MKDILKWLVPNYLDNKKYNILLLIFHLNY